MRKHGRRKKLQAGAFPAAWKQILEARFPLYARLSAADRRELEGHVQVFLAEKEFQGCDGLVITDEIRVCIAAQACLLLLHRETDYYPELRSIAVFPSTYFVQTTRHLGGGVLAEGEESRLGEASPEGAVVLAWDAVCQGTADPDDGSNVVFHEFAHQLDFEDGWVNGAPALGQGDSLLVRRSRYAAWARVLSKEFERLRAEAPHGQNTVLNGYGATNPAEFFAVATEAFFERPLELREKHAELYEELKKYYRQDPAQWLPAAGVGNSKPETNSKGMK